VPGQHRLGEPELGGERRGDRGPVRAERSEGPDRTAELGGETLVANADHEMDGLVEAGHPTGRLEAEGRRKRLLEQRPPGHRRSCVPRRELRGSLGCGAKVDDEDAQSSLGHEHRCAVDDVLARGAVVDEPPRLSADLLAHRTHERLGAEITAGVMGGGPGGEAPAGKAAPSPEGATLQVRGRSNSQRCRPFGAERIHGRGRSPEAHASGYTMPPLRG